MKASTRRTLLFLGTLLCALAVAGCGAVGGQMTGAGSFQEEDIRKVVGVSTHIFAGRVVAVVGNEGIPTTGPGNVSIPRTQFSVEVLENIKGELSGTVIVDQIGGAGSDSIIVDLEGDSLLQVGKTYLLATEYGPDDNWYGIVAQGYGNVLVEDATARTRDVERFRAAIAHQILPSSPEFEKVGPVPAQFLLPPASERTGR